MKRFHVKKNDEVVVLSGSNKGKRGRIISVLANGLRILSVAQEWQTVVTGCIIILAVYADILRRRTL